MSIVPAPPTEVAKDIATTSLITVGLVNGDHIRVQVMDQPEQADTVIKFMSPVGDGPTDTPVVLCRHNRSRSEVDLRELHVDAETDAPSPESRTQDIISGTCAITGQLFSYKPFS